MHSIIFLKGVVILLNEFNHEKELITYIHCTDNTQFQELEVDNDIRDLLPILRT